MRVRPGDADALQGLDSTLAVIDELHTAQDEATHVAMLGSLKSPGSVLRVISTAAPSQDSPLGRLRARALALPSAKRTGAVVEAKGDSLHLLEWSTPDGTKLDDRKAITAANPASFVTWSTLKKRRDAMPESSFRRYFCNEHSAVGESSWLPAGAWAKCRAAYTIEDGERVALGVDIGGTRAATAVVWVGDDLRVGVETWEGDEAVIFAEAKVRELAEKYVVESVSFDPWRFRAQAMTLQSEGLRMIGAASARGGAVGSDARRDRREACGLPAGSRCRAPLLLSSRQTDGSPLADQALGARRAPAAPVPATRGERPGSGADLIALDQALFAWRAAVLGHLRSAR